MRRLTDVDLRLLRVFVTIVDCNGFQNAQVALNMAQSTLSSHLAALETTLGGRLCERGRRGFRLTRAGEETYAAAQVLFRAIEGFGATMGRVHGRESTRLRIGMIDTLATFEDLALPEALAGFAAQHPDVFLDIEVMPPGPLHQAVTEGRRDLVIGPMFQAGPTLTYVDLLVEDHRLYCGRTHAWFQRPDAEITLADFHQARFSVRAYQYFDDTYKLGGVKASASVANMEAQEILILSGGFLGFLPVHKAAVHVGTGAMRAIKPRDWTLRSRFLVAFDPKSGPHVLKRDFADMLLAYVNARRLAGEAIGEPAPQPPTGAQR